MAGTTNLCNIHFKTAKFLCISPCLASFCTDCAIFHRNHIIRDLVSIPLDFEINTLNQSKQNIMKNMEKISKEIELTQKVYKIIEDSQIEALCKVDEEYKNVQKVLSERVKVVKNEIIEKNSKEKQKICKHAEDCREEYYQCNKKLEIIDMLSKSRPECILSIANLLDPTFNAPLKIKNLPKFEKILFPLLRNPEKFFDSI